MSVISAVTGHGCRKTMTNAKLSVPSVKAIFLQFLKLTMEPISTDP